MHNAPPVVYPVGRFVWGRSGLVALCVLSAVGIIGWQMLSLATGPKLWAAWCLWGLCAVGAWYGVPRQTLTEGHLGWSGESWFWQAGEQLDADVDWVAVSVCLDTGQGLLLRVQPLDDHGKPRGRLLCAWLAAEAMPSKWHGFRCAVYSRPKAAAPLDRVSPEHH